MSTTVFPTLKGRDITIDRTSMFSTRKPKAVSGKIVSIAQWASPLYQWTVTFNFLRTGLFGPSTFTELEQLRGFFEKLKGAFDSFLFQDPNDNVVVGQAIANTSGLLATTYQLQRTSGGATAPILAPNLGATFNLYVNAVLKTQGVDYSVTDWSSGTPGLVTFLAGHVPAAALPITADFSYYFPCSFDDDTMDFGRFGQNIYKLDKQTFTSLK